MKADKTSEEYESLRQELPPAYQENWLPLLGSCALFVIVLFTGRRGNEGLLELKKTAFAKLWDDDTETWAYEKVVGELSRLTERSCSSSSWEVGVAVANGGGIDIGEW